MPSDDEVQRGRVVALGAVYLDVVCDDFPYDEALWPEREAIGPSYRLAPGGSAVNFSRTIARLDVPTSLVGKIGADIPGRMLRSLVGDAGVDLRAVVDADVQTNLGLHFNGVDGTTILTAVGSANQAMHSNDVAPVVTELLDGATHLYLGGCAKLMNLLPTLANLAEEARRRSVTVVVDHGRLYKELDAAGRNHVRRLCSLADFYVPSVIELKELWESDDLEQATQRAVSECSGTVIVKNGAAGVTAMTTDGSAHAPAYDVEVMNLVGAGDSFNAGFIRAQLEGRNLTDCLAYGCATAALKISQAALPDRAHVEEILATAKVQAS